MILRRYLAHGIETAGKSGFQVKSNKGLTPRQAGGSSDAWSSVEMAAKAGLRGKKPNPCSGSWDVRACCVVKPTRMRCGFRRKGLLRQHRATENYQWALEELR